MECPPPPLEWPVEAHSLIGRRLVAELFPCQKCAKLQFLATSFFFCFSREKKICLLLESSETDAKKAFVQKTLIFQQIWGKKIFCWKFLSKSLCRMRFFCRMKILLNKINRIFFLQTLRSVLNRKPNLATFRVSGGVLYPVCGLSPFFTL